MMTLWTLLATLAWGGSCDAPVAAQALDALAQEATLAYALMDDEAFLKASGAVSTQISCLNAPLTPSSAAGLHRLAGLRAFFDGESSASLLAFRAALYLEPGYTLSAKLAPEGGKLWRTWNAASHSGAPGMMPLTAPSGYTVLVNGTAATARPAEFPAIMQILDGAGALVWSGRLEPLDAMPWHALGLNEALAAAKPTENPEPPVPPVVPALPEVPAQVVAEDPAPAAAPTVETPAVAAVSEAPTVDLPAVAAVSEAPTVDLPAVAVLPTAPVVQVPAVAVLPTAPVVQVPVLPTVEVPAVPALPAPPLANARKPIPSAKVGPNFTAPVATAVAAGLAFGVSAYARTRFDEDPSQALYWTTNGAWIGSVVLTTAAAGLTVHTLLP